MNTYVGIVHQDNKGYGISFPDFIGCVSAGANPDDLAAMAEEALSLHIEGMLEDGERIPAPMALDKAKKHPLAKGAVAFVFVRAYVPGKPKRLNIMMDSNLVAAVDKIANNRSAFIAESVRHELERLRG